MSEKISTDHILIGGPGTGVRGFLNYRDKPLALVCENCCGGQNCCPTRASRYPLRLSGQASRPNLWKLIRGGQNCCPTKVSRYPLRLSGQASRPNL